MREGLRGGAALVVFFLAASLPAKAAPFWVQCDSFKMHFTDNCKLDVLSVLAGATWQSMDISPEWFNIANTQAGATWMYVQETNVSVKNGVTTAQYIYEKSPAGTPTKWCTIDITPRDHFVEFSVREVVGDCGDIRLLGVAKNGSFPFNELANPQCMQLVDSAEPDRRWYCGVVPENAQTQASMGYAAGTTPDEDSHYLLVRSARALPTPSAYVRDQKFALFVCTENDISNRLTEIEIGLSLPPLNNVRLRPENNLDYLFLLNTNGATAEEVIDLCRSVGIHSVLLSQTVWCDWDSIEAPFNPRHDEYMNAAEFIATLQSAGIRVGAHAIVHAQSISGYYYNHTDSQGNADYAHWMTGPFHVWELTDISSFTFEWNTLPEIVANDFLARMDELGFEWLYLDGVELAAMSVYGQTLIETGFYQINRIFDDICGVHPFVTIQSADGNFHYDSRSGQTDFWDVHWATGLNVFQTIDEIVRLAPYRRISGSWPNLAWFGRQINTFTTSSQTRDATCDEWAYAVQASLDHDIPLGIRTSYQEFMTDPLRPQIVPLLRDCVRKRRHLGDHNDDGTVDLGDRLALIGLLGQATTNPRIDFNLDSWVNQNDLLAFDSLYPLLPDFLNGTLPSACPPCLLPGDINGDGGVNGGDVAGFVRVKFGAPVMGDNVSCADYGGGINADTAAFVADLLD